MKYHLAEPEVGEEEKQNVMDALESGWISSRGEYIPRFENEFSAYCGVKHGTAVFNGTVALHLALAALNIGPKDEVIVPSMTFIATANTVRYAGATPVFADCDPETWTISPESIEKLITPKTKAIIPVHLHGHPAHMDEIMEIAEKNNLYVIEDVAEAHGAKYKGKMVGGIGDVACFSFFGNKVITTGEGGMCITNNTELDERMKILRNQGTDKNRKYYYPEFGFNYRMTNLQAAIGVAQMTKIDKFIERKRAVAKLYNENLERDDLQLPVEKEWAHHVYWMYTPVLKNADRDKVMKELDEHGVENRPFFFPIHLNPPYQDTPPRISLPVSEYLGYHGIMLPSHQALSDEDVVDIANTLKELL